MGRSELMWEEVKTEHVEKNQWIDLRKTFYRLPNRRIAGPFYSYTRRDYAVIAATDEDGRFICVRQFRQGIRTVTTEFPAGGIERGDGEASSGGAAAEAEALAAAKRELLEETGYVSDQWSHLLTIPSHATTSDNYAYIYRAENCKMVARQKLDQTEFISVAAYSPGELEELIREGGFQQAVHVLAWLLTREGSPRLIGEEIHI